MDTQTFSVNAIGHIRAAEDGFYLEIAPEYRPALNGLDGFGHINVLWWLHLYAEYREVLECDRPYKHAPDKVGIFATRAPVRPNPIALTTVAVTRIDHAQGRVYIPYIDAEDGSPILDIKPYHPCEDRVRDVKLPSWCAHWPQWVEDAEDFDWAAEFVNAQ